ncbi:MAG TPA: hypothetical protein VIM11_23445 [Tepidisphaeraceae bacterium]|jgi:hypothetical protein
MRVRLLVCIWVIVSAFTSIIRAADSAVSDGDGVVTWTPSQAGAQVQGKYKPSRWGMYDVEARLENAAAGKVKLTIAGKDMAGTTDGAAAKLGRIYIDTANERPLAIETEPADAKAPLVVKSLVFTPAPEGKPIIQADDLSITLHAHDATVHGVNLRYEFRPDKNTLGYWSNPKDWVSWDFEVKKPGKFNVVAMQGSPGTKEITITVADQTINYSTKNTGSFHTFTFLEVGTVTFDKPGIQTLTLKPKAATGPVMDLRQVILLPVLK